MSLCLSVVVVCAWTAAGSASETPVYRSPQSVAIAAAAKTAYVSDRTAGCVAVLKLDAKRAAQEIGPLAEPCGIVLAADGKTLYVAERKAGCVAVIDTLQAKVTQRISVGPWPFAVALSEKSGRLYVCQRGNHSLGVVDLGAGKLVGQVPAAREPAAVAVTPDGSRAVVTNLLPVEAGTDPRSSAEVTLVDTAKLAVAARIKLPPGSTSAYGACVSPDGRWAYVVHALGRFTLPITQLERGWVHTYGLTVIDLSAGKLLATLLMDDMTGGAADPWDVVCSADGLRLFVSHSGIQEVSIINRILVHELLEGKVPPAVAGLKEAARDNIWVRISQDRTLIDTLVNDLTALYLAGAIRRVRSGGDGPRGLAISADGKQLLAANYYAGTVGVIDPAAGQLLTTIPVGIQPQADAARRGEIYFHDAGRCFQRWHSCATCHPDARVDALPWDFMRDGIGNGKDVISLVGIEHTSPHNRRATRANPHECMRTGVLGSHFVVPTAAEVDDLTAYAFTLRSEPNPVPPPAEAVARGRAIFEGKAGCAACHPGPHFTDFKMHNVGITHPSEPDGLYDTPSLVEIYRTAPYLHNGRAATLRDVLTVHNPHDEHGHTKDLQPQEVDDLVAYLLSL